ncbi:MAG: hypothetical protein IPL65_22350 [Lewinellaceae bacterium]|nr:hypothetical protein [Lewinellaceae bacterium]
MTFLPVQETDISLELCAGESYGLNGVIYDANNPEGTQVLQSVNGCDSLVTVHLSFRPVINGGWDIDICQGDSIVINGHAYNEANP